MDFFRRKGKGRAENSAQPRDRGARTPTSPAVEEDVGLFPVEDIDLFSKEFDIDIIAVHGLGGNWRNTWIHPDTKKSWIHEFLPTQLREAGIKPRIMSYGYDANTAFSRSIESISSVAEDLLDRLKLCRPGEINESRPILLISHSLGGLVVKKAMIMAWYKIGGRYNPYGDLLRNIRGLIFFGVPHRGADLAFWASIPANLLDIGLIGFGANTRFLDALKRNSPEWREISKQFVQRADAIPLIRTYFETKRLGNILIVDQDSALLNLPNEICKGVSESNHRTVCRFESKESQRYVPIWQAVLEMCKVATTLKTVSTKSIVMVSPDAPVKVPNFYGRQAELDSMLQGKILGSSRKSVVLWGLGGFGKSQLALQFQSLHFDQNVSRIWIDVRDLDKFATFKDIVLDLLEYEYVPLLGGDQMPSSVAQPSKVPLYLVKARLEDKSNRGWLMIIDGVDDIPSRYRIEQLLPQCDHGSIIMTTTRSDLTSIVKGHGVEVGAINESAGVEMFLSRFPPRDPGSEVRRLSQELIVNLDGCPLAIEQASADLLMQGPLSVTILKRYLSQIGEEYARLMDIEPELSECYYDKDRSLICTFNLLKKPLQMQSSDAIDILTLFSSFGRNNILMSMLTTQFSHDQDPMMDLAPSVGRALSRDQNSGIFSWSANLSEESFRRAVMALQKFSCIKVRFSADEIRSLSVQNAIQRWCQGILPLVEREQWSVLAAYTISHSLCLHEKLTPQRAYLPILRHLDRTIFSNARFIQIQAPHGTLCWKAWMISLRFARFYSLHNAFKEARTSIERAIDYERLIRGESWLTDLPSLKRFQALATYTQDDGDFPKAAEAFLSLLTACKDVLGSDHSFVLEIARQSSDLHHRMAHDAQLSLQASQATSKQQQVLLERLNLVAASVIPELGDDEETDEEYRLRTEVDGFRDAIGDDDPETQQLVSRLAALYLAEKKWMKAKLLLEDICKQCLSVPQDKSRFIFGIDCFSRYIIACDATACSAGPLLDIFQEALPEADIEARDALGYTPLQRAAEAGSMTLVQILIDNGANPTAKSKTGYTPLHLSLLTKYTEVAQLLLQRGADIEAGDKDGRTPLHVAVAWGLGGVKSVKLLLEAGADIGAVDVGGRTPLHYTAFATDDRAIRLVSILLEKGADINAKDNKGITPYKVAVDMGRGNIAMLLRERGAKVK